MSRKFWITVAEIDKKEAYWTWSKQRILKKCLT